jgi:hypothetical protein
MWSRASAILGAAFVVVACEHGPQMEQVSLIPACAESHPDACDDGRPLCMLDEGDACMMCRCVAAPPLTAVLPPDVLRMQGGPLSPGAPGIPVGPPVY